MSCEHPIVSPTERTQSEVLETMTFKEERTFEWQ